MNVDNREHDLSPEELEVEKILQDATRSLDEIDFWIRNPRVAGPKPTPPGFSISGFHGNEREHQKKLLECRRDVVKAEAKEQAVKALDKSPLATQLRGYNRIDNWAEPKEDRQKNIDERTGKEKDISDSQDVAMLKLSDAKQIRQEKTQLKNEIEIAQPVEPQTPTPEAPSFWDRFDAGLGFSSFSDKDDYIPEKSDKEIEPEIEPDR